MGEFDARVPLWAIASGAGALLAGVFFLLRFLIGDDGEALAQRLVDLHPTASIGITRAEFKKYEPPVAVASTTQLERIRAALADEIQAGGMAVEPVGDNIVVRVSNLVLFASGKADTKPEFEPAGAKIAAALDKEPGPIHVIGHTDNVKPKASSAFKSNFDLSVARAKSVEAVLGQIADRPVAHPGRRQGRSRADRRQQDAGRPRAEPPRRDHDPEGGDAGSASRRGKRMNLKSLLMRLAPQGARRRRAAVLCRRSSGSPGRCSPSANRTRWSRYGSASPSSPSCVVLVLAFYLIRYWRRRRAAKALEKALKADDSASGDGEVLAHAHGRGDRHAEAVERQADLPLRAALVRHHRPARRRQDHGAGQFRA